MDVWKREIGKKNEGKCAAIKKPSTGGRVFEFFTVFIYVEKKRTLFFSVTPALCHFDGAVDVSLRVQYLHPPLLTLYYLDAFWWLTERVIAQMWQRRTNTCDCRDDLISFWDAPRSLSLSHLHAILDGQSAPCSIASFYDIVYGLHCCNNSAKRASSKVVWFDLSSTEGCCCLNRRLTRLQQTCIAATPHLTRHALSLCHTTILTNTQTYTRTLYTPTDRKF